MSSILELLRHAALCVVRRFSCVNLFTRSIVVYSGGAFGKSVHAKANYNFVQSVFPERKVYLVSSVKSPGCFHIRSLRGFLLLHFSKNIVADNGLPYSVNLRNKVVIQTWHAPALKNIGLKDQFFLEKGSVHKRKLIKQWSDTDVVICSGHVVAKTMQESFLLKDRQLRFAFPPYYLEVRRAALVANESMRIGSKNRRRTILYMPTYRDWATEGRSWDLLLDKRFVDFVRRNELNVIYKYHPLDRGAKKGEIEFDANFCPLSGDYLDTLIRSDLLITDYSSVIYEALLIGKTSIIHAEDEVTFRNKRGLGHDLLFASLPRLNLDNLELVLEYFMEVGVEITSVDANLQHQYFGEYSDSVTAKLFNEYYAQ